MALSSLAHASGYDSAGAAITLPQRRETMGEHPIRTDLHAPTMQDPVAFFITWPTYGTWLPGDNRGWVEYRHGWRLPQPAMELECRSRMKENACILNRPQRRLVESQVAETCEYRGWVMHAVNCRSNHMHIVVTAAADTHPKKIRIDLKAWCTRRLKEQFDPARENWWAERGSVRYVWNTDSLENVIQYTKLGQDKKSQLDT